MTQHQNPLERERDQSGVNPDPQTFEEGSTIGDDAGMWTNTTAPASTAHIDDADSGRDPGRAAALESAARDDGKLPPPTAYRPDTVVRAHAPEARVEMERGNKFRNEPSFTKGHNAPTADHSRMPYTTEDMDRYLREAPRGVFPDTPGGAGATPLSADRSAFIDEVTRIGHFPSRQEAEKWTRAIFNALRHRAIEIDDAIVAELAGVVRVGESPEVQVEEMMWGGDFVDRFSRMVCVLQGWSKAEFYQQIAEEYHERPDDPWVDAAVYAFFGALKRALGDNDHCRVGELQDIWDRA